MDHVICCICHRMITSSKGNSPEPVYLKNHESGLCCDDCNRLLVLPTRIALMRKLPAKINKSEIRCYIKTDLRTKVFDNIRHKTGGIKDV